MTRLKLAAAFVLCSLVFGPSLQAVRQEVTLRYRWTKGTTDRYRVTQQSSTTLFGLPTGDLTFDQTITQVIRTVVQDVSADGAGSLQYQVESARLELNSPMAGQMVYDSTSKEPNDNPMVAPFKTVFSALIGEPFTIVMSPQGAVVKVEGFTKFVDKVFSALPQDPASAPTLNALKAGMSDDGVRAMIGQGFPRLDNRPVKLADTWTSEIKVSNPILGGLVTSLTSTLKAVEGSGDSQVATIATRFSMKQDPSVPVEPGPMGMTMRLGDSTGEGEVLFKVAGGQVQRSTTRMTMPMTMSGNAPDGSAVSMKTNTKHTLTTELIK